MLEVYQLPRDIWIKEIEDIKPKLIQTEEPKIQDTSLSQQLPTTEEAQEVFKCTYQAGDVLPNYIEFHTSYQYNLTLYTGVENFQQELTCFLSLNVKFFIIQIDIFINGIYQNVLETKLYSRTAKSFGLKSCLS